MHGQREEFSSNPQNYPVPLWAQLSHLQMKNLGLGVGGLVQGEVGQPGNGAADTQPGVRLEPAELLPGPGARPRGGRRR